MKAKLRTGRAGDSVDTAIEALIRKLSMEGSRQQRIVGGSNHFHGATFSSLCFNQRLDDDENGGDELRQNITEKHSI